MQSNPPALTPFTPQPLSSDPTFSHCSTPSCRKSWGLRLVNSSAIHVYGAGLYSFFDNYDQSCLATESCQENIFSVEQSRDIHVFGLNTKASERMVMVDHGDDGREEIVVVPQGENRNGFCSTVAVLEV